jgi:hypothetical protein
MRNRVLFGVVVIIAGILAAFGARPGGAAGAVGTTTAPAEFGPPTGINVAVWLDDSAKSAGSPVSGYVTAVSSDWVALNTGDGTMAWIPRNKIAVIHTIH